MAAAQKYSDLNDVGAVLYLPTGSLDHSITWDSKQSVLFDESLSKLGPALSEKNVNMRVLLNYLIMSNTDSEVENLSSLQVLT